MAATYPRCNGKVCYPSRAKARKYSRIERERVGAVLRIYFHRDCGAWHLTKQPPREDLMAEPKLEYRIIARDDGGDDEYEDIIFETQASALRTLADAADAVPPFDELYIEQREVGPWERAPAAMQAAPRRVSQG